jgi:hypothetical protein
MRVRVTMCISLIFAVLTFTGQSIAEIDPQTLAGLWLFDEGGRT